MPIFQIFNDSIKDGKDIYGFSFLILCLKTKFWPIWHDFRGHDYCTIQAITAGWDRVCSVCDGLV